MQSEENATVTEFEEVSYVAWGTQKPKSDKVQWYASTTLDTQFVEGLTLEIKNSNTNPAAFFAAMQTTDGGDTSGVRYKNLNDNTVDVFIEEETSRDDEVAHTTEVIGFIVLYGYQFQRGVLFHDTIVEFGTVLQEQPDADTWYEVPIHGIFLEPIVVMGPLSYNGTNAATARVKDVTQSSFKWSIQEWLVHDVWHMQEAISYMVVEKGLNYLYDGTWIEAGTLTGTN